MLRFSLYLFLLIPVLSFSQIPAGYYNSAAGLTGTSLRLALHNIIDGHNSASYSSLWSHFQNTDKKSNGKVWDMYSDRPASTPPYEFTFNTDQCGSYGGEGDCFNREHSFPASWFNDATPMYTDLFHLIPTDGYVNGKRSNYAFGNVTSPTWTSQNGSKLGPCSNVGYSGTVFEPIDTYKGDFARTYFYMSTRYYTEDGSFITNEMITKSDIKPWALEVLKIWHIIDPVSTKEINRNNAVYNIQGNRNPFIDHPEYVEQIWGTTTVSDNTAIIEEFNVYPNPAKGNINIVSSKLIKEIIVTDVLGRIVYSLKASGNEVVSSTIDLSMLENGQYYFQCFDENNMAKSKMLVIIK